VFGYRIVKKHSEVDRSIPYHRFLELNKSYKKLEVEARKAEALAEINKREADRYKGILLAIQTLASPDRPVLGADSQDGWLDD
jgi:hypothetical protein